MRRAMSDMPSWVFHELEEFGKNSHHAMLASECRDAEALHLLDKRRVVPAAQISGSPRLPPQGVAFILFGRGESNVRICFCFFLMLFCLC